MKFISSVVYFLIAGILSTTVAQLEQTDSQGESHPDTSGGNNTVAGFADVDLTDAVLRKYAKLFNNTQCEKNGGLKAYDGLEESMEKLKQCIASAKETEEENPLASQHIQIETHLKKLCPRISEFKNCSGYVIEPITACIEPKTRGIANITFNMINSVLDFTCADNGHRITDFIDNEGIEYVLSQQEALMNCTRESASEISESQILDNPFNIEGCTAWQKLQHCTVGILKKCQKQAPANVIDSLFNVVIEQTPCKHLLESSSADINLLSITALMGIAISLRFA